MKASIQNIRTKVDKRQIVQYLLLRQRILNNKVSHPTNESEESTKSCKIRNNEILLLIGAIKKDTIDKKIRKMHQYIHKQNEYVKGLKEDAKFIKKESEGCGKYFQHGVGEFMCGGALHVDGKKKLCANCTKDEVKDGN